MADFPMSGSTVTPNGATAPSNPVNDATKQYGRTHNKFNESYPFMNTMRFADAHPFFIYRAEAQDRVSLSSNHKIKAYTMTAPLMQELFMNKDYFAVPYYAIMPNTYELIYTPPTQGDDVPDDAPSTFRYFPLLTSLMTRPSNWSTFELNATNLELLIRRFLLLEMLLSNGSLLSQLGCKLSPNVRIMSNNVDYNGISFDKWAETVFYPAFRKLQFWCRFPSMENSINHFSSYPHPSMNRISFRRMLELMRDYPDFQITYVYTDNDSLSDFYKAMYGTADTQTSVLYNALSPSWVISPVDVNTFINIDSCVAYQIVMHNFYVNDHVDYIFTAKRYRNAVQTIAYDITGELPYFSYNSEKYFYDVFSQHVLSTIEDNTDFDNLDSLRKAYYFYESIFALRHSLRYGDYFTGGRPSPLAVGDINTPVVSEGVNAIDLSVNLLKQRYFNQVNRVGSRPDDYNKVIMGASPLTDRTEPRFIAHTSVAVGSYESAATSAGDSQGNVVTNVSTTGGNFAFELDVPDRCIILGIATFSIQRIYGRATERFFFHKNRFDSFNPFMQYAGDQAIYRAELQRTGYFVDDQEDAGEQNNAFAYALRHMEYKQRYAQCAGGFYDWLKSWAFVTDNPDSDIVDLTFTSISPDYIRSKNVEFDRFMSSITGYGLSAYFHFIVSFNNECFASRAMDYNPSVL